MDVFNNASQVWNHNLFWQSLTPEQKLPGEMCLTMIERSYGSYDSFKDEMMKEGGDVFGSGWV